MIVWDEVHVERMCSGGALDVRDVRVRVRRTLAGALGGRRRIGRRRIKSKKY